MFGKGSGKNKGYIREIDRVRYRINWAKVKGVGELRILTRGSYLLLFLVPILAAIWPAVRLALNSYNSSVQESVVLLNNASVKLELSSKNLETHLTSYPDSISAKILSNSREALRGLDDRLHTLIDNGSELTIQNTNLPSVWVVAFLASLLIFIAHMIYQSRAPNIIREFSFNDYINDRKDHFRQNRPTNTMVESFLIDLSKDGYFQEDIAVTMDGVRQTEDLERLKWELGIVGTLAEIEYRKQSQKAISGSWIVFTLYTISIAALIYITLNQTHNVLNAAGWV